MHRVVKQTSTDPRLGPARPEPLVSLLAFYLGVPLACAFVVGASTAAGSRFEARWMDFLYPMVGVLPKWAIAWGATWLVAVVLRPWRPHLLVVTSVGALLANHLSNPWSLTVQHLFQPDLRPDAQFFPVFPWRYGDPAYLTEAAIAWASVAVVWGAANAFWVYVLGYRRFGYERRAPAVIVAPADPAPGQPQAPPAYPHATPLAPYDVLDNPLTSRLPPDIAADVIALCAKQHHTRVYGQASDALVLIRFSDAIQALGDAGGLQVHRSYWLRPRAVTGCERTNGSYLLTLSNGLRVPVGRSFKREVERADLTEEPVAQPPRHRTSTERTFDP